MATYHRFYSAKIIKHPDNTLTRFWKAVIGINMVDV